MDIQSSFSKKQLVEKYGEIISRLARRMIHNNEMAKEATQEVWFEILRSLENFRGNSELSTWIYTIAKRTILKYARNERIYKEREIDMHFDREPIDYSGTDEDKKQWIKDQCDYCLTAFCHCLNNEARLIFLFRDIAGLEYAQIAQIMQTSEENIRKISSRSKEKVRKFMNKDCILYNPEGNCRCRIKKQIKSIDFEKTYNHLAQTSQMIEFFLKFDKELPVKSYWEKYLTQDVTN